MHRDVRYIVRRVVTWAIITGIGALFLWLSSIEGIQSIR